MESESHQQQQLGYGLLRFRSAPSSLPRSFSEAGLGKADPTSEGSFEADKFGSRFMGFGNGNSSLFEEKAMKESPAVSPRGYTGLPLQYPRQSSSSLSSSAVEASYGSAGSSLAMDHHQSQNKSISSNISRQSSSPPSLFSQISTQNGYGSTKGAGNYRAGSSGFNGAMSPTSNNKWKLGQFSCPSSFGVLPQISEIGSASAGEGGVGDRLFSGSSGLHFNNSWNGGSSLFSDNFSGLKRIRENDIKLFSSSQNGELRSRSSVLSPSHHLNFPRSSSEMSTIEKLMHFQDTIPCKIRAKRGCATHPRSIAERVRRTRISERMRKLQELVPHMDKQTNTADMLDLAVEYIKDLQKQFKALSESRANCKCLSASINN
ncbi:hypothetical protein SAY86_030768 [Trapa natans]|uniref:BHLH domain-containing protein n=1 Tax=Trapa natans TaxID=22666 RepID=A0AAN7MGI4_TRANT|nr:hypothetical protein SAY86_030768 [Trapa natans]